MSESKLTRVGVFYDGNYFLHVSNFYNYAHERKSRISVSGLHNFIRNQIAKEEDSDPHLCPIVDAHYFKGRISASEASVRENKLYSDRIFDDVLSAEGVTTHYLPLVTTKSGGWQEKGIDVWLALEAFEQAFYKRFDVFVLVASDGDYVPLIRKLNTLGTRVMVLSWDFEYTNDSGVKMVTRTSQDLLESVTYPIAMSELVDNRVFRNDPMINGLFVPQKQMKMSGEGSYIAKTQFKAPLPALPIEKNLSGMKRKFGKIKALKEGFGFIENQPRDAFFFHADLVECDFNDLEVGYGVEFKEEVKTTGEIVAKEVRVIDGKS